MSSEHINKIIKRLSLSFVVLFLFLSPLSISLTHNQSDLVISPTTAHAGLISGADMGAVTGTTDQNTPADTGSVGSAPVTDAAIIPISSFPSTNGGSGVEALPTAAATQVAANAAPAPAPAKQDRSLKDVYNAVSDLPATIGKWIGEQILSFCAFLVWIGGSVLDYATNELVLNMGKWINTSSLGTAIDETWKMIRDICNLAFIFGLVYTGISTIIDPEKASTKRFLSRIIIGALLINFSLFFVKFIIDFANFTTYHIYTAMTSGTGTIAAKIADVLGIVTFYSSPSTTSTLKQMSGGGIWFFLGASIFLLITAFTLFAAGIMLIGRFVALVMIMIFSPILFAATVFPQTEAYASKMWHSLISYAFFAPVYVFLLLVSITMLDSFPLKGTSKFIDLVPKEGASTSQFGIVVFFIVAIYFMISALTLAQKIGVAGGSMAISVGKNLRGRGQQLMGNATFGLGAAAGRATVGRVSHSFAENERLQAAADAGGMKGWAAQKALNASKAGAHGTYDVRNTKLGGAAGLGAGSSSNYESTHKENKERDARNYARTQQADIGTHVSTATSMPVPVAPNQPGHDPVAWKAYNDAQIAMERSVAGASTGQLKTLLGKYEKGSAEYNAIVRTMSASQYDALMKEKPEEFSDKKRNDLKTIRSAEIQSRRKVDHATPGEIGKATASELDVMDINVVTKHADHLSMKQIDDMKSLTDTGRELLKNERTAKLIAEFNQPNGPSTLFARITNDTEISKLPVDILKDPNASQYLTIGALGKIPDATEGKISTAELISIKNSVLGHHYGSTRHTAFDNFFKKSPAGNRFG